MKSMPGDSTEPEKMCGTKCDDSYNSGTDNTKHANSQQ